MPRTEVNGYEVHYELDDYTDPWASEVDTIVIQHGIGRNAQFWRHWIPALAGQYRVVRRDFPGHGQSPEPAIDVWTIDRMVEDLVAFLRVMGLKKIHYLGESTGGRLGAVFAQRFPELLKTLTLCATPLRPNTLVANPITPALSNDFEMSAAEWTAALVESRNISPGRTPQQRKWVEGQAALATRSALAGARQVSASFDLSSVAPNIRVPTLVLAPTGSPILPIEESVELLNLLPNGHIALVENDSHEAYVDQPEECIRAFLKFIQAH